MSSTARVFQVHGNRFDGGVAHVGDVAAAPAEQKPSLPDGVIALLMELQPRTPAEKQELNDLISDRFNLNKRTLVYIERALAARRADLEAAHEQAKEAVRAQGAVIENLKRTLVEDSEGTLRAQNLLRMAQSAAHNAEQEAKSLSRFASQKEVDAVKRRIEVANKKMEAAEAKAGELGQALNYLKAVTIPAENKKLEELIAREMELAAQLEGRDPTLSKFGFQQR
jgi:Asp-tRNA(Asn)/Glu-tRNA(Gln) amidotransferase A subunit family amidase